MNADNGLIIKQTKNNGKGEEIFQFIGLIIRGKKKIVPNSYLDHHCIQVSKDSYIDNNGELGDFINHSCGPTGGFQTRNGRAIIMAIRDIEKGEEITFDYSTSMAEDRYEMDCNCGSENCRKRIRDFKYLPKDIQEKYIKLGAVQRFVINDIK